MSTHKFADLHCHPASRPLNNGTRSMWEGYCYDFKSKSDKAFKKVILKQLRSERGVMYDQSGFPKLLNGNVKLAFASIYPLEKGFLIKKSIKILDPNSNEGETITISKGRNFLLTRFTNYPVKQLKKLKDGDYWKQFELEYNMYWVHSSTKKKKIQSIAKGSKAEIKTLLNHPDLGLSAKLQFKGSGRYTIIDGANPPPKNYNSDTVYIALTVEGMGFVTQVCGKNSCSSLKLRPEKKIMEKLAILKQKTPIFFVTFCHHFDNGVCGHARSFIRLTKLLKLNQEKGINNGFTDTGLKMLKYLLSIKNGENGKIIHAPKKGRRIFVDMKHMSFNGRSTVIDLVSAYNATSKNDKIPLISSHTGFTGLTSHKLKQRLEFEKNFVKKEQGPSQSFREDNKDLMMEVRYNTWSINLSKEEVRAIVKSEGLIGLSFEQNILGIAFMGGKKEFKIKGKKNLKKQITQIRTKYTQLMVGQLCTMAKASRRKRFWKCICIGTDFDGLINPIDGYSSALLFELVRSGLIKEFTKLTPEIRKKFFLPTDVKMIESVVDDFCFNNAANFLKTHYDSSMPVTTPFLNLK